MGVLSQIKDEEKARKARAVAEIKETLAENGRALGGRYILFGSFARGDFKHSSDVDLILDFPLEVESEAFRIAEDLAERLDIDVDLFAKRMVSDKFMKAIERDMIGLP